MPSYISSIGISNPKHKISQDKILAFMQRHLPLSDAQKHDLAVLYRASGIKNRYSVIKDYMLGTGEYEFYPASSDLEPFPDVDERMKLYEKEALKLAEASARNCLDATQLKYHEITHLITVSCTGMSAPGLDVSLIDKLAMNTDVERYSVNFMGCYAAFNALKLAKQITENNASAKVLICCVELCSIHFQKTADEDNLLSSTLFSDGAASVLVSGVKETNKNLVMRSFYSDLDLRAREEMSWKVGSLGFLMKLSSHVPETIRSGIKNLTERLLKSIDLSLLDIDYYAIHPGGKRILEVIEEELGMSKFDNLHAYETLKNYGNMSSPTILFVLQSLLEELNASDNNKNILSFAFGPGLTLESMLLKTEV